MTFDEYCEIIDKSNFMIDNSNPYDMKIMNVLKKDVKEKPIDIHPHSFAASVLFGYCPICKASVIAIKIIAIIAVRLFHGRLNDDYF